MTNQHITLNFIITEKKPKPFRSHMTIKRCFIMDKNYYYLAKSFLIKGFVRYKCTKFIGDYTSAKKYASKHKIKSVPPPFKSLIKNYPRLDKDIDYKIKWLMKNKDKYQKFLDKNIKYDLLLSVQNSVRIASCRHSYNLNETKNAIFKGKKVKNKGIKHYHDIINQFNAEKYVLKISKKKKISEKDIFKIHSILTKNLLKKKSRGSYCKINVVILRKTLVFPSPKHRPKLFKKLIHFINKNIDKMNPVDLSLLTNYELINIHPFSDANGRVARLLSKWILLRSGYPSFMIESSNFNKYDSALNDASYKGDKRPLVKFWKESIIQKLDYIISEINSQSYMNDYNHGKKSFKLFFYSKEKPKAHQGYKIHISATRKNAPKVLKIIMPFFSKERPANKFVDPNFFISAENTPNCNLYGKFITIYTENPKQAAYLTKKIDSILFKAGLKRGRKIKGDIKLPISKSNMIYYRYGAYHGNVVINPTTKKSFIDNRKKPFPKFLKKDMLKSNL